MVGAAVMLSVFVREPEFLRSDQGIVLANRRSPAHRRAGHKDPFDHWLSGNPLQANSSWISSSSARASGCRRRAEKEISRKTA